MRCAAIVDVGNWRPDQPSCQEYELYLRMLVANKRFQFCPTAGAVYRLWSSTTVCRKDPHRTLMLRLRIIDAVEEHLQAKGELTEERRDAIAHGRLESARGLYQIDRQASRRVAELARSKHPKYRLDASGCFPRAYRLVYHSLGFQAAESLAQVTRRLRHAGRTVSRLRRIRTAMSDRDERDDLMTEKPCLTPRVRAVFVVVTGLLAAQCAFIHFFGEPYPALTMPTFSGSGGYREGAVEMMRYDAVFISAGAEFSFTPNQLLADFPDGHRAAIAANACGRRPTHRPAPARLLEFAAFKRKFFPGLPPATCRAVPRKTKRRCRPGCAGGGEPCSGAARLAGRDPLVSSGRNVRLGRNAG